MKLKKIAAAALAAVLFAVSTAAGVLSDPLSVSARADETFNDDNLLYTLLSDGTFEVKMIDETLSGSITIPEEYEGRMVTSIAENAFRGSEITSITIGKGITKIGKSALAVCLDLASIVVDVDNAYFTSEDGVLFNKDKTQLLYYPSAAKSKSYTVPQSVTRIENDAFCCNDNIVSVTVPDSVKVIRPAAFTDCKKLKDVYFGGSRSQWETIFLKTEGSEIYSLLNANIHFAKEDEEESDTSEPTSSDTSEPTSSNTSKPTSSSSGSSSSTAPTKSTTEELPAPDIPKPDSSDFRKENEVTGTVETSPDAAGVPESDRITSITINPAFNMKNKDGDNVELDLSKITVKASEIYDEEGLKRAEEALGETLKGNKKYNLLDLTLLYDGKDFSNGYESLVKVIIPLPKGHRDKTFSCYRLVEVNGKTVKQLIPGEQTADSYIIYLEHFSQYALVADGDTPRSAAPGSNPTTGAAMAAVPVAMIAAAAAVLAASRKRK